MLSTHLSGISIIFTNKVNNGQYYRCQWDSLCLHRTDQPAFPGRRLVGSVGKLVVSAIDNICLTSHQLSQNKKADLD